MIRELGQGLPQGHRSPQDGKTVSTAPRENKETPEAVLCLTW